MYEAVQGISDFACELGLNIPTGKDSLSMTQKYKDDVVYAPGTVIISAVGEVSDLKKVVEPVLKPNYDSSMVYVDFSEDEFKLGGSSFAQTLNRIGKTAPHIKSATKFAATFDAIQNLITDNKILAGHDISAGGMLTALLEMTFAEKDLGLTIDLSAITGADDVQIFFSEKSGVLLQVANADLADVTDALTAVNATHYTIGNVIGDRMMSVKTGANSYMFDIDSLRDTWYKSSFLLDQKQSGKELATERFNNYKKQPLSYQFPEGFKGDFSALGLNPDRKENSGVKAAIIREKGVNGDREMAYAMYLAGFDVKDVHMTDLISGAEDLSDVNFIAYVGGFSNSDVLGSAKGWAGAFLYNEKAKAALDGFYARENTMSLGICNGFQLMGEIGLLYP
jgi:phosphoribosylformylglycinamidine synthase